MKHNFTDEEMSQALFKASLEHPGLRGNEIEAVKKLLAALPEPAKQITVSQAVEAWNEAQHEFGVLTYWENLTGNMQNQLADFAVNLGYTIDLQESEAPEGQTFDPVQKAKHYNVHPSGIECIDVIRHYNYCIGAAMKYLWRNGLKEEADMQPIDKQIQDLEKAVYYIEDEISRLKEMRK